MNTAASINPERIIKIERLLTEKLAPTKLNIIDDSHKHAGHHGSRDGAGHYTVQICSKQFAGLATLARHRLVYAALGNMMPGEIHALIIEATVPAAEIT